MRHPVKAEKFFSKEERARIHDASVRAEARTVGEIAVAVVDQSSQYHEAEFFGGVFFSAVVSLVLTALFFHSSVWSFIPLAFILYFPFHFLFRKAPALKRVFVGRRRMHKAVKIRALRTFYEKGLYRTKENTGVLFFLSLLERKVWVLADTGIHTRVHQPTLNKFADMVSTGISQGRAVDALCESIEGMGDLLATHYPASGAHCGQFPDEIICGPGATETDEE